MSDGMGWDGIGWLSYTAVTPRASLQSDAKKQIETLKESDTWEVTIGLTILCEHDKRAGVGLINPACWL